MHGPLIYGSYKYKWIIMHEKCRRLDSNGFHLNEALAPMAIEKIKILGAVSELPAKQPALPIQPIYLNSALQWSELAKLAVLFSW